MSDIPFFVQALIGILISGNAYFLVQHFGRMRAIEDKQQMAEVKLAVFATTADSLKEKLDLIESRTSAVYGMLVGTPRHPGPSKYDSESNR